MTAANEQHLNASDRCSFCPSATTGVVVTVNGHLHDTCHQCALALVDSIFVAPLVVPDDLPAKHRLLEAS